MKSRITLCFLLPLAAFGQTEPHVDFVKPFSVDSLTYVYPPFNIYKLPASPSPWSQYFNIRSLNQFECPLCAWAPSNRTRFTIPDFGSEAKLSLLQGRLQFSASLGATEAWLPDGLLQAIGHQRLSPVGGINALKVVRPDLNPQWGGAHLFTTDQYNDAWLAQSRLSARLFLDPRKNISIGVTKGYMYNFSVAGTPSYTSTTADLTITFGDGPTKFLAKTLHRFSHKHSPKPQRPQ